MNDDKNALFEEPVASWLTACEDAIAAGQAPRPPEEAGIDPDLVPRLRRMVDCLEMFERVWPFVGHAGTAENTPQELLTQADGKTSADALPGLRIPGFTILGEIGKGGMGIVYKAWQESLKRHVALKFLPPALANDPDRLARFKNEATLAAGLANSHILPVFDIPQPDGVPVLVMQYVDGCDLGRILTDRKAVRAGQSKEDRHPWALLSDPEYLDRILPLLDKLVETAPALEETGIVHRDIKPSNILVDRRGNMWLTDFGLARLAREAHMTSSRTGVGTPGYMSPEQWEGLEDVDSLADIFSIGVTLYVALTLELPYGRGRLNAQTLLAPPPSKHQRLLSRDFDTVLLKALEPDRKQRYRSAKLLHEDWGLIRQGLLPKHSKPVGWLRRLARQARRHRSAVAAGFLGLVVMALLVFIRLPAKPDPTKFRTVQITTDPTGARVVLVPFDEYQELRPERKIRGKGTSPLVISDVPVGNYWVVVDIPNHGFHEVHRTVPKLGIGPGMYVHDSFVQREGGVVELPIIRIAGIADTDKPMAYLAGGKFTMGKNYVPGSGSLWGQVGPAHAAEVAPFYMDTYEVTVGEYRRVRGTVAERLTAMYSPPPKDFDSYAISWVNYYQAVDYAEQVGKRLPTGSEYEYAATNGGTTDFPWGNDRGLAASIKWRQGIVKEPQFDHTTTTNPTIFGLYSNVAEWTDSVFTHYDPNLHPSRQRSAIGFQAVLDELLNSREVRGGPMSIILGRSLNEGELVLGAHWRSQHRRGDASGGLGFRCVRSAKAPFMD
jgi:formylglycine-generating enzyme required for sulfatase activity/predicted Ser/Thr protein kinase